MQNATEYTQAEHKAAYAEQRNRLLKILGEIQNHPANINQDIMTFAGFMDNAELLKHIGRYGNIADAHDARRAA